MENSEEELERILPRLNRFLSTRERASSEIRDYLRRKKMGGPELAEAAIVRLREMGLQDDLRFARNRAEYRREKAYGPLYIRNELNMLRVDSGITKQVLAEQNREDYLGPALERAERKLSAYIREPEAELKIRRMLASRGYESALAQEVVRALKEKFPHWGRTGAG